MEAGIPGSKHAPRIGQPNRTRAEQAKEISHLTLHRVPLDGIQWSQGLVAQYTGVSIWRVHQVRKVPVAEPGPMDDTLTTRALSRATPMWRRTSPPLLLSQCPSPWVTSPIRTWSSVLRPRRARTQWDSPGQGLLRGGSSASGLST